MRWAECTRAHAQHRDAFFGRLRRSYDRKLRAVLSAVWVIVFALACEGESPQRGGPHAWHSNGTGLKIVPYAPAPQRH